MKLDDVNKIRRAALHVVSRCDDWIFRFQSDEDFRKYCDITGYRESGAVKRAVLDFKHDVGR